MKRYFLLILLVFGISLVSMACGSSHYRHGYPGYGNYPYYSSSQLRSLADDLEDATSRLVDEAKDVSHRSDSEDYAVDRFEDLDNRAEDFKSEVDDERDFRRSGDDYRDLVRAYQQARETMRYFRDEDVYREFDRVAQIMNRLNRMYGGYQDPYGYNPGYR